MSEIPAGPVRIECWFGRGSDGRVVFEQWSVWVAPVGGRSPWCRDVSGYGDGARVMREIASGGLADFAPEGPFPVVYEELGSRARPSGVAPAGLGFWTRHGTARVYAS